MKCRMVPIRVVSRRSGMRCVVRRLLGPEDAQLIEGVLQGLALEKLVEATDLQLQVTNPLLDVGATELLLRTHHLQGDRVLLVALLHLSDPLLQAIIVPLDGVGKAWLRALELLQNETQRRIKGILRFVAAGVVIWVRLHGSMSLILDCYDSGRRKDGGRKIRGKERRMAKR
jgi:hypothetical protein